MKPEKYMKLIKLIEKMTGMKYKVIPNAYYNYKERPHGFNVTKYTILPDGRVKFRKVTIYVRHYKTPKLDKKYPFLRILIHELIENLYYQNKIRTEKDLHDPEIDVKGHNFAKLWEKRVMNHFLKITK